MRHLLTLLPALLLSACMAATSSVSQAPTRPGQQRLTAQLIQLASPSGDIVNIEAEMAVTKKQQETGLMHRTELAADRGMLFVFEEEEPLFFWMKNTLIPLDVLYFDADGRFVSSATMQPCTENTCPTYGSEGPASYALEIPAGETVNRGIGAGWSLLLP